MVRWWKRPASAADSRAIQRAAHRAAGPPTHFYYVLPGTGIYGGVKKGFHCADLLSASGHPCTVATPDGTRATWFDNSSAVITRDELARCCRPTDAVLFSCPADAAFVDALPAGRTILHMQGANTPADWEMIDPARGYECISHGLHMTYRLQERGRVAPYVAMGIPDVFRWRGEPKVEGFVAVMRRKGDAVYQAVREALPDVAFVQIDGLSERDTAARLKSADVFLAISAQEALGLPPLEAMTAGCAVVGFPGVGGFEFMRHLETALVVPNGDGAGLVAAVARVLADPVLRDGLRERGQAVATYYTMDRERRYLLRALGLPVADDGEGGRS
ncbi:MAG: glycosyltransferase [Planctomycetia bacterium]|nr:glycosyltransferase [Planctomycetia bacterium]